MNLVERLRDKKHHPWEICDEAADTIESLRRELEEAKEDSDTWKARLAFSYRQREVQAATIAKLREAMETIVPYRAYNGDDWPSNVAKEALAATESNDQGVRNGETK